MKTISATCMAGLLIACFTDRAMAQPLPVPPLPEGQTSPGVILQPSGKEPSIVLPMPSSEEPAAVVTQAGGKEPVSVTPSGKEAKKASVVQPVEEPLWEIALMGGVREFTVDFKVRPSATFDTTPWHSSDTLTRGYGGLELRRILRQADTTILRFGLGYSFSSAKWSNPEPKAVHLLDGSQFSLRAHQLSAMVDFSWQVSRAWQVGARVGPILSLFDGEFTAASGPSGSEHEVRDSGTEVSVGVMGEVFLRYTVPDSSFFVELRAGYAWSEDVSFGDSSITADLDGSTWLASLSLGYEF